MIQNEIGYYNFSFFPWIDQLSLTDPINDPSDAHINIRVAHPSANTHDKIGIYP